MLGAARKYSAISQHGQGTPISSLHYFADLFEEVRQQTSPGYWNYIAHKVKRFEQTLGRRLEGCGSPKLYATAFGAHVTLLHPEQTSDAVISGEASIADFRNRPGIIEAENVEEAGRNAVYFSNQTGFSMLFLQVVSSRSMQSSW